MTLQFVLAFPLVLILFLAVIEFGFVLLVQQTISAAAQEGARVAARGAVAADVLAAVNEVLSIHNLSISAATTDANVVIEQSNAAATTITGYPCTPVGPALPVAPIEDRVTVCVKLKPDGATSVWQGGTLPDLLAGWGFPLNLQTYTCSALAMHE